MNDALITCNVDMTGFNRIFHGLADVVEQDGPDFVRDETARLAEECARQLSMRNQTNKGQLKRDIRSVFAPLPSNAFTDREKIDGHGMKWLAAGPQYLTGVKPLLYHVDDSVEDMLHIFWRSKGTLPVDRTKEIGVHELKASTRYARRATRGHQKVYELQRLVVRRGTYKKFVATLKKRFGRLEASFAYTAELLRSGTARVSAKIRRHFPSQTNITDAAGLADKSYPRMEFGSFAPGVTGFEEYIENALAVREHKMVDRYNLIINGYSKDVQAGIAPRRHAKETAIDE